MNRLRRGDRTRLGLPGVTTDGDKAVRCRPMRPSASRRICLWDAMGRMTEIGPDPMLGRRCVRLANSHNPRLTSQHLVDQRFRVWPALRMLAG